MKWVRFFFLDEGKQNTVWDKRTCDSQIIESLQILRTYYYYLYILMCIILLLIMGTWGEARGVGFPRITLPSNFIFFFLFNFFVFIF